MKDINLKKILEEKGFSKDKIKKIIESNDYEIYKDGVDLIARNTGLQYEDIKEVMQWLSYYLNEEEEKKLYEDYLSVGPYDNYIELDYGYTLFYND